MLERMNLLELIKVSVIVAGLHVLFCEAVDPVLIVHGGAGTITGARIEGKKVGMVAAIRAGFAELLDSDNPLNAVEAAVRVMEDLPDFNAGYGSVLTDNGEIEMDAIVVNGTDLSTGAVGAMKHVRHPISVARFVMNSTKHVFLVGQFAERFASNCGFELVPTSDLIPPANRSYPDVGTVGAVAINSKGNIAVATSTGGMSGKMEGRVGDTPIVGAGTLADDSVAGVSGTGTGEAFIRFRVATKVAALIEKGANASEAILTVLNEMTSVIPDGDGGAIAITKDGEVGFNWNSQQMAWAYVKKKEMDIHFGVDRGDDFTVPFQNSTRTESTQDDQTKCTPIYQCINRVNLDFVKTVAWKLLHFGR